MNERIKYLDGLRGLAILLVIGFHAYSRWTKLVPYHNSFSDFPLFKYGNLGVQLFFVISGFVILLTLEKCKGIKDFLFRRWLRLFPAMLSCSILIYITSAFFYERPAGQPTILSLIPGVTFMDVKWWEAIIHYPITRLEGAFWSLFVEFKFYVFAAIVYYNLGRNILLMALIGAFAGSELLWWMGGIMDNQWHGYLYSFTREMSFQYFGWFSAGSFFYMYYKLKQVKWFLFGICMIFLSSVMTNNADFYTIVAMCLITGIFALTLILTRLQSVFTTYPFQIVGVASYPLYLIHENMMISMIIKISKFNFEIPYIIYPIVPVFILILTAYFISKYIEPIIKNICLKIFSYMHIVGERK